MKRCIGVGNLGQILLSLIYSLEKGAWLSILGASSALYLREFEIGKLYSCCG